MIKLIEDYSDFISKEDATYAEGSFVDFAKSVKRYIKSEQMKGRFNGWDVDHYFVPEIDNTTKEIRNDSFALVFTKNKKNMFYIETFMKPDRFTTTITCPILGIRNDKIYNCNGKSDELLYNGGFNSHLGFESMISNYIRPTMKDVDAELGTFSESKRVRSKRTVKESSDYAARKRIASNIASWAFGSFNMNDIDDNIDFLVNRWFKSKSESFKNRMYISDTYEELAYVLADCDLNTLKAVERGLCIDDDSIAIEQEYLDSFNESKITEMTSDEQREETKRLKADVRDLLDRVKFDRIPEATMAMYETDKKGFRESLIQWAIECDGGNGSWTIDKIYVGSLEGKAPILYKFNNALSLIMLTTGNGAIVKIAKSGSTRIDPPWTKLDAVQTLYSWLKEYIDQ